MMPFPVRAALAFAVLSLSAPAAVAATITVVGEARVAAEPDSALVSSGVVTQGKTAADALAANSKAVSALIEALKGAGVAPRDLATSNFSLQPQYAMPQPNSREAPRLVGFEVTNSVRVKVAQLDQLGKLLDQMVQAGANQTSGLVFTLSDRAQLEQQARTAAVKDAMAQAEAVAAAAGLKLVRIVSVTPESNSSVPMLRAPMMMKAEAARMAVPVEAGEVEVQARATLVYDAEPR
ncbi:MULTISPECIES: SIMPL domain-containing protein [unclassified Xanthobacter]|uniref:SIMPL domain-containing protein n=1 Tax=unclassified Xanthobacter TaxID=2623496 RepID=UPI001EDE9669|nr:MULTISPECIES: SIMPL domain-containing protein [unclassified Xanthobacter]